MFLCRTLDLTIWHAADNPDQSQCQAQQWDSTLTTAENNFLRLKIKKNLELRIADS